MCYWFHAKYRVRGLDHSYAFPDFLEVVSTVNLCITMRIINQSLFMGKQDLILSEYYLVLVYTKQSCVSEIL